MLKEYCENETIEYEILQSDIFLVFPCLGGNGTKGAEHFLQTLHAARWTTTVAGAMYVSG